MDILEYAEKQADDTLKQLRTSYDDLHERLQKVVTALVGGAGAAGAYALSKMGPEGREAEWAPVGTLAATWFLIAAVAALRGARSQPLSPGNGPSNILAYYEARLRDAAEAATPTVAAMEATRRAELVLQQRRLTEYAQACVRRARVLDVTYLGVAFSPLLPLLVLVAIVIWG